jgi:hypothetical protein
VLKIAKTWNVMHFRFLVMEILSVGNTEIFCVFLYKKGAFISNRIRVCITFNAAYVVVKIGRGVERKRELEFFAIFSLSS